MIDVSLKPCPFCGDSANVKKRYMFAEYGIVTLIQCFHCGAQYTKVDIDVCEEDVINGWNRRTAPEARVLTLDELWDCGDNEPVYLECKLPNGNIIKPAIFQPECSTFTPEGDDYMCLISAWRTSGFYSQSEYGKTWRCWNHRPTFEQRKAVKWNE